MPIAVLSPAKSLIEKPESGLTLTEAPFDSKTNELLQVCSKLSRAQIKSLMDLSDALAALNHGRFQNFETQDVLAAGYAFDGPAHQAWGVRSLDGESFAYAQENILTLSGLYGCLRPLDAIQPYRLEMGTKLITPRGNSLYAFWGDTIASELGRRLSALPVAAERFIVNVASEEYWAVVGKHLAALGENVPVYTIRFPGPSVYAKQARGLYCRFMCEQRVKLPRELEGFGAWSSQSPASKAIGAVYKLSSGSGTLTLTFSRSAVPVQKLAKTKTMTAASAGKAATAAQKVDNKKSKPAAKPAKTKASASISKKRAVTSDSKPTTTTETAPKRRSTKR